MNNRHIDSQKGIACLLIILIHCRFPGLLGQIVLVIARPAVFYFFLVSGYYSYYEDDKKFKIKMPEKIHRLVKLMIVTFGLYFFWECILRQFGSTGNLKSFLSDLFSVQNLLKVVLFQVDVLVGPFWFLLSLFLCYAALLIIGKKRASFFYMFIPVDLVLNIVLSNVLPIFNVDVSLHYYRNFWLTGFPFYLSGYFIHNKKQLIIPYITKRKVHIIGVFGITLSLLEYCLFGNHLIYVGSIISVMAAFIGAILEPDKGNYLFERIGKKYSMYIYCLHWFVIDVIAIISKHSNAAGTVWFSYSAPFIVILLSISGAMIIQQYHVFKSKGI